MKEKQFITKKEAEEMIRIIRKASINGYIDFQVPIVRKGTYYYADYSIEDYRPTLDGFKIRLKKRENGL